MAETKIVLVIDDDFDIIETVNTVLTRNGYVVVSATSGRQGFDVAQRTNPDLILCDMMMEEMDSGAQAAQKIKRYNSGIPIYLISNLADQIAATTQIREFGFIGFIQKPIEPARLVSIVQSILH